MKGVYAFSMLLASAAAQSAEPCTNYETAKADYDAAKAAWSSPACYSFNYQKVGLSASPAEPTSVTVQNGVASGGPMTMEDFMDMIEEECFSSCPIAGAYECVNKYAVAGYPLSILIDVSETTAGEEMRYTINSFSVQSDCPDPSPTEAPQEDAPEEDEEEEDISDKLNTIVGQQTETSGAVDLR
jgi:hypothetical protein